MPPFRRQDILAAEELLMAPIFSADVPQRSAVENPEEFIEVPDDIRTFVLDSLTQATTTSPKGNVLNEERARLQLRVVHNLEQSQDSPNSEVARLYDHQKSVQDSIKDFIAHATADGPTALWGYIQMPTGTGKTGIFTSLIDKINKPTQHDSQPLKTLVLVPKLDLVGQTIGLNTEGEVERGFAKFASNTTTSEYHGTKKDLSGDAVVMTYRSFNKKVREGNLDPDLFDALILDEAHNALGRQVQESIRWYGANKLMIGLTASSEYGENKKLDMLLPHKIHTMHLREAIEEGLLASVRGIAVRPDEYIETLSPSKVDFTDRELAKLIDNEWRNQKAVQFAKEFVAQGKQGIIACVPGQDLAHARLMAERLNNETVEDPDGTTRSIKAKVVGHMQSSDERREIYEAYERGEWDVLTYVDVLTEGWDSLSAKFIINLRPTTSPVNAVQRMGRILRPNGDTAIVVEFIDRSDKPQFTFFHAIGAEEIDSRKVYGPTGEEGIGGERPESDLELSDELLTLIAEVDHRLISELIVQPEMYEVAAGGVLSVTTFSRMFSLSPQTIERILNDLNIEPESYLFGNNQRRSFGLTPEQQTSVLDHPYFSEELAPKGVASLYGYAVDNELSRDFVTQVVEELGIEPQVYKFGTNRIEAFGLTDEQQAQVKAYIDSEYPFAPEGTESMNTLWRNHHTSTPMMYKLCEELGITVRNYRLPQANKGYYVAPGLTREEQDQLFAHPFYQVPELTEDIMTMSGLEDKTGFERQGLMRAISEAGLEAGTYRDRGKRILGLNEAQFTQLQSYLAENLPVANDESIRFSEVSRELQVSASSLAKLAEKYGITIKTYRFQIEKGQLPAQALTPQEAELLRLDPIFATPTLQEGYVSLEEAARRLNTSPKTVERSANLLDIPFTAFRIGMRPIGKALTEAQIETIRDAGRIPAASGLVVQAGRSDETMDDAIVLSVKEFSKDLKADPKTILAAMGRLGLSAVQVLVNGRVTDGVTKEQMDQIRLEPYFQVKQANDYGAVSLDALLRRLGVSPKKLAEIITELGLEPEEYRFGQGKGRRAGRGLNAEQIQTLESHSYFADQPPVAGPEITSLSRFAKDRHMAMPTIQRLAASLGITLDTYRLGANKLPGIGMTQEQKEMLEQATESQK